MEELTYGLMGSLGVILCQQGVIMVRSIQESLDMEPTIERKCIILPGGSR